MKYLFLMLLTGCTLSVASSQKEEKPLLFTPEMCKAQCDPIPVSYFLPGKTVDSVKKWGYYQVCRCGNRLEQR